VLDKNFLGKTRFGKFLEFLDLGKMIWEISGIFRFRENDLGNFWAFTGALYMCSTYYRYKSMAPVICFRFKCN